MAFDLWLSAGCPPDNQIIISGCLEHDLIVSDERTTAISNAVDMSQFQQSFTKKVTQIHLVVTFTKTF